ncbi:hypothetical protein BK120_01870 [Paenibacillus sp. FSL A5-0031]|uniref:hypothetical protein n=1 Tax=Paenibacillus sp. FSL A5-0031 TaxID=1920420 RepID=UPI00096FDEE6|nr:hypothetical protein [Paenibacillus sp. FSL A5-0031]OME88087.1 hypothetical protein BK120_01870 [Paenibacillus sp. FSL A5-0031]
MEKKRCLFCSEIVPIEQKGEYERYLGCNCAPGSYYSLLRDSYLAINSLSYPIKNKRFPIISGYIREQLDCGEKITLTIDDLETIEKAPHIPLSIEDKEARLLQYLYRHSDDPGQPIVIQPLSQNFNLTYSPNLQELVYIVEKLREAQLIVREGITFKLTEKGWNEAAARAGGRKLKTCGVLLPDNQPLQAEWFEHVFPKLEQFGYLPFMFQQSDTGGHENHSITKLAESKLIIADITSHSPEVYFAAGYALGANVEVVWTMNSTQEDELCVQPASIRPMIWDDAGDLAALLQQRLSFKK